MFGSLVGNVVATIFFLVFQIVGIQITIHILKEESRAFQVFMGSVLGSFALHWLPALYSLFLGFNIGSNLLGMCTIVVIGLIISIKDKGTKSIRSNESKLIWALLIPTFIYVAMILATHTIPVKEGAIYTGQCTFGDMNLHLGIITSIAKQGMFPPEYSIFPGVKLAYPFLSDSISSSLYVFGSSLRFAYILPMLFAFLQVFYGFYVFAYGWLKKQSIALIAWVLFFFNGGFGVFYFLDGVIHNPNNFTRMFTEFYNTPTNLTTSNIRWVNVIVDMLIPQRATLFGYAILFSVLCLLYRAVFESKKHHFILAGILTSGLPMIHTHSFLVVGIISATWCLYSLYRKQESCDKLTISSRTMMITLLVLGLLGMDVISYVKLKISEYTLFMIPITLIFLLACVGIYLLVRLFLQRKQYEFLQSWGIFLLILAIPVAWQLMTWTFRQASASGFVKGYFNWGNEMDSYLWFYVKNMGMVALLIIPAMIKATKRSLILLSPAILIWFIAEFIVFQPNVYDNNKLLYPAYGFLCCIVADYINSLCKQMKADSYRRILLTMILVLSTSSALLTMIREFRSEYELFPKSQVELSQFLEENTPPDAIVLTNDRHNNAISCLTGRNILCGTGAFLYYHGIDYTSRMDDIKLIYENVEEQEDLLKQYKVDYILVGPEERVSYPDLQEELIRQRYPHIYQENEIVLYAVSQRAQTKNDKK